MVRGAPPGREPSLMHQAPAQALLRLARTSYAGWRELDRGDYASAIERKALDRDRTTIVGTIDQVPFGGAVRSDESVQRIEQCAAREANRDRSIDRPLGMWHVFVRVKA